MSVYGDMDVSIIKEKPSNRKEVKTYSKLESKIDDVINFVKKEIKEGNFREDLYHRLGVILINNPSLDERKEDIPVLTEHFNKQICEEHGIAEKTFSPDALKTLQSYSWSGNIREFRNVIERLIILC